jgi:hypothetical protein
MKHPVDEAAILQNHWYGQFLDASVEQQTAEVAVALLAARRGAALARLRDEGWPLAVIAEAAGLTTRRICQLIARDRDYPRSGGQLIARDRGRG